jgi:hypothetical protein
MTGNSVGAERINNAAWKSPGKVKGCSPTPPRRTSWIPTSPSPLRNSFTTDSLSQATDDTDIDDDDDEGNPIQGILVM